MPNGFVLCPGSPLFRPSGWRVWMAKEELMQFDGLVIEILPDARYRVQLDQGHEIVAYTAGKMKKNRIKTLAGDRVTVERNNAIAATPSMQTMA